MNSIAIMILGASISLLALFLGAEPTEEQLWMVGIVVFWMGFLLGD